jgi:hypothetical protein
MRYMLLIYSSEGDWDALSDDERQALYAEYGKLSEDLQAAGRLIDGSELQPVSTATTVRVRAGESMVTDGPFAETKEQLGGYYLIEAADLDEALDWAARIPSAKHGAIEVRPLVER